MFSVQQRCALLRKMCDSEPAISRRAHDVTVASFDGLVVEFAKANGVTLLVRGLRAYSDFEYEFRMAVVNRKLSGIETAFLMADDSHSHISSSLIRDLARWKRTLPGFVPASISAEVYAHMGVPRP